MALIDRVQRARTKAAGVDAPNWALATADVEKRSLPELSLAENQARLFQQLSWVNAAINTVAKACALQAYNVYRYEGERRVDVDHHPFEQLMARPNPLMSRYEFLYATVAWRKLTGNAYWWLNRANEREAPAEAWIIPSRRIQPVPDGRLYIKGYVYEPGDGQRIPLEPWEVMHFKGWHPSSDFLGASDVEALSWVAEGDYKQSQYNVNFFSEDNAKFPGVLAFSDPIGDSDWRRIQAEFKAQGGGTKRQSMRMLRNVGAGGVQWVQTNVSQRDMEFLGGRQFNKEEMWAVLAPGLASVLDVNATEANAMSGRKTLIENAVWPELVAISEKVVNGLLPAYGDNLTGEFEDPRITDRALELEERKTWQVVHTVDEVREHYDGDEALGDERGALLVPQVEQLGGRPEVSEDPAEVAQRMAAQAPEPAGGANTDTVGDTEPEEDTDAVDDVKARRDAEIATWRRYARKHGAVKAARFSPDHLPPDVARVIGERLAAATSDGEVDAAFSGPFLVKAVRETADGERDPNADAKERAERRLMRLLKARLNGQLGDVLDLLGDPPDTDNLTGEFWDTQAGVMLGDLRPELERFAEEAGERWIVDTGVGVDWALAAEAAAAWAEQYAGALIRGVNETTARVVRETVGRWLRTPGRTVGQLRDDLSPYFGERRAQTIAVTETTRAYAEGEYRAVQLAQAQGFHLRAIWHTSYDELVCELCAPLNGQPREEWARLSPGIDVENAPPRHVNCRCWVTHEWTGETR